MRTPARPHTLAEWLAALEAGGWKGRKSGREWSGPCPLCGGVDRFHVAEGSKGAVVLAHCRHGCTFDTLAGEVFPRPPAASGRPARAPRPPTAPEGRRGPEIASRADSGVSGGGSGENDRETSPVTRKLGPPKGRGTPGIGPPVEDYAGRMNTARKLWGRSRPVPASPEHPARRWAVRRHLWPPGEPWPDSVRWLAQAGGGSLVACFAPVAGWAAPDGGVPAPSGVHLVHVDPEGRPRKDRGGLGKRSRGSMTGAACVIGGPLDGAGRVHVAEGIADALAIAARCGGSALAAGGTSGFEPLARPLARLHVPVTVWPDGDTPGRLAASRLALALEARGIAATVARVPDGEDPASLADSRNQWRRR